jgi:hypothetical protein
MSHAFKGSLEDYPLTVSYGEKVDSLRRRYHEFLWDAEFRDTHGAEVSGDGKQRAAYTVFKAKSGMRAAVIMNKDGFKPAKIQVQLPGAAKLTLVSPEQPDPRPFDGTTELPARSTAVVLESQ